MTREETACFTGHRSQKLPWGFDETDRRCRKMKRTLRSAIKKAIKKGKKIFLCGMALGFDMICAETVIELKKKYSDIKLIGAIPCKDQDKKWPLWERIRYRVLITKLDGIRCIYEEYNGTECLHERNCYMVDCSSYMIALYSGQSGGTQTTVEYAKQQGLEIVIIQP